MILSLLAIAFVHHGVDLRLKISLQFLEVVQVSKGPGEEIFTIVLIFISKSCVLVHDFKLLAFFRQWIDVVRIVVEAFHSGLKLLVR